MDDTRLSAEFLDRLLGFQQALDRADHADEIAVLVRRMVEGVAGVRSARLCLGGAVSAAPGDDFAGCHTCSHRRPEGWALSDRPDLAGGGCCGAAGWRSVPLRTHRRLLGFLLLRLSEAWSLGGGAPAVAAIANTVAMVVENRDLRRTLAATANHLRNLRDQRDAPPVEPAVRVVAPVEVEVDGEGGAWAVKNAMRMLLRAVEQSPASIVMTRPGGAIEYVNPGFTRISGYQPEEVIGRDPSMFKSGMTPPEEYRAMWTVIQAGGIWRGEFHNRRKDGSLFWVAASISPVRDEDGVITHYIAVEEDITELKALQARLTLSEERYRGASEASLDGLFILDAVRDAAGSVEDFRFAEVNAAGCAMVGRRREAILGRPLSEVLPFARAKGFFEKYRRVHLHHEVLDEQFEIDDAPGAPAWIHHTVVPLAQGVAITSRNITDMKRTEAALMAARAAAEEANAAKSVFLATMSHELRTPLNAILGFSEMIRDEVFGPVGTPRYRQYAADIHTSGQHLLDLITAILDISKIEAGKLEIEPHRIDLRPALGQCVTLFQARAEAQGLTLITDLDPDLPMLWADERAVRQIVLNLLANSVKFTPKGGRITLRAVGVGADRVEISVTDTGIGIPEDHVDRVMRPFEQLDNSYTRGAGGTGLGLALVKALTELHGGSVLLSSRVNQGTSVTIRLPVSGPGKATAAPWSFSLGQSGL